MAEIPQGALEANFPSFVKEKKSSGTIPFQGKEIELFTFSFLGVDFGTGVNKDLAERLINAQAALYPLAYLDKLDESRKEGKPLPAALTPDEFKAWCWLGQEPSSGGKPQIQKHGGAQDRDTASSKHSSGSAVDLNYQSCPWMPVRDAKGVLGGEINRTKDPAEKDKKKKTFLFKGDFRALYTEKIWKPAFVIFDRANALFLGKPADVRPEDDRGKADDTYHRFRTFSYCLQVYFRYAFHPRTSGKKPLQKPFEEFKTALDTDLKAGLIHDNAVQVDGTPLKPALQGPDAEAAFRAFYDKIVEDFAFMPMVITVGVRKVDENGVITLPTGEQRDPCNGTFNMRKEVFMELVVKQKLRWGGSMFGPNSGDTMHFDLGGHFIDGVMVAT